MHRPAPPQRSILLDASSAILLFKVGMLEQLLESYRGVVAFSVYRELTVGAYPGAREIAFFARSGVLEVSSPPASLEAVEGETGVALASLGAGERDTILHFYQKKGEFVIIDDGRGARCCRSARIPFVNALLVPRIFSLAGRMPEDACNAAFEALTEIGRYSRDIVDYARRAQKEALAFFLPLSG